MSKQLFCQNLLPLKERTAFSFLVPFKKLFLQSVIDNVDKSYAHTEMEILPILAMSLVVRICQWFI